MSWVGVGVSSCPIFYRGGTPNQIVLTHCEVFGIHRGPGVLPQGIRLELTEVQKSSQMKGSEAKLD